MVNSLPVIHKPEEQRFLIPVTEKHIRSGKQCNSLSCPVSLAMTEFFDTQVSAVWGSARFVGAGKNKRLGYGLVILPGSVERFMNKFDYKKPVKPFRFRVSVPVKILNKLKIITK